MTGAPTLRSRRLRAGILAGLVSRGLAMIGPLVVVPVMVSTFGIERYGVWATAVALVSAAVFADFGLGSGLLTRLTESVSRERHQESRDLVVTALVAVSLIALTLGGILAGLLHLWPQAPEEHQTEGLRATLAIIVAAFIANLPLSLVHRAELAFQAIVASNVWQAIGSVLSVLAVVVTISAGGSYLAAVLASALGVPVANALNWLWFCGWRMRSARLRSGRPRTRYWRPLLALGLPFLLVNGLTALAANGDLLIVSHSLGFSDGGLLSVAFRYMGIANILIAAVSMAFWPSVGDALAQGDRNWIRRMTRRTARWSAFVAAVLGLGLAALSPRLMDIWLGPGAVKPGTALLLAVAAWFAVQAFFAPFLALLSAAGLVWRQVVAYVTFLAITAIAKFIWIDSFGAIGVIVTSTLGFLIVFTAIIFVRPLDRADAPVRGDEFRRPAPAYMEGVHDD